MKKAGQPEQDLSQRVRRTLQDLALIRQSLTEISNEPNGENAEANSALDLELAAELKVVVDMLRELLWAYISALSAKCGRRPHEVLEWYKMELAVAMLRKNKSGSSFTTPPDEENGEGTFQELITKALTITAMHTRTEHRL